MLKLTTNHHCHPEYILCELPQKYQEQLRKDYAGMLKLEDETYIVYLGEAIPLCEFMRIEGAYPVEFRGWSGYTSNSAWDGVLIKGCNHEDCECDGTGWICARYLSVSEP